MQNNVTEILGEIEVSYKHSSGKPKNLTFSNSSDAVNIARTMFNPKTINFQEEFIVAYLNRANRIIGLYSVSKGGISGTVVDLRIVFAAGLKLFASGLILFHNHPSGNLTPSQCDINLTNKFKEGGKLLEISVLDHLIISPCGEYYSFADNGLL